MAQYELGKWNLDELAKNPNRKIIDKKLARIESDSKRYKLREGEYFRCKLYLLVKASVRKCSEDGKGIQGKIH